MFKHRSHRRATLAAWSLPFFAVAVMAGIGYVFDLWLGSTIPYALFFLAVAVSALLAGFWPATLAIGLSAVSAKWLSVQPRFSLGIDRAEDLGSIVIFCAVGLAIAALAYRVRSARQSAEDSSERLDQVVRLLDLAPVLVRDMNDRILRWNFRCQRLFGFTSEQALGRISRELLQTQFPVPLDHVHATLRTNGRWEGELKHIRSDGKEIVVYTEWVTWHDASGLPTAILEINTDITGSKQAEEQMRSIAQFPEENPNPLLRIGEPGAKVLYMNRAAETLLASEDSGQTLPIELEESVREALRTKREGELDLKSKDGRVFSFVVVPVPSQGYVNLYGREVTDARKAEEALRVSEKRFTAFMDHLPGAAWIKDLRGKYVYANPEAEQIFSTPLHAMRGRSDEELFPVETAKQFRENDQRVLARDKHLQTTEVLRQADGREHHSLVSKFVVPDLDGRPAYIAGVAFDITEHKQAQEALNETQAQLKMITDTMAAGVAHCSRDKRYLWVSSAFARWLRRPAGEIAGRTIAEVIGMEAYQAIEPYIEQVLEGKRVEYEAYLNLSGPERVWVHAVYTPTYATDPTPDGWIAVVTDITQRKRWEEATERLAAIVESTDDAIISKTLDGTISTWNKAAERMFGYRPEEVVGKSIKLLLPPDRIQEEEQILRQLKRGERFEHYETVRVTKDGRQLDVSITTSPLRDHHGRLTGASKIVRDITERKREQEALHSATRELEAANAAKDQFLAVLSHELRTPLTPVLAAVSLIERKDHATPDLKRDLEVIRRNVALEARLIDDLLDLTRIARGKITLDRKPINISTVLKRAVEICVGDIKARKLHFYFDIESDHFPVNGDSSRLQQVFWNLLKNSIKFTPEGGCLGVRCRRESKQVIVEVSDSGIGIEPEALSRIFGAFEQASQKVTRQFGGLGLGLAITKRLVEMHDGSITARSAGKGQGATFRVILPLVREMEDEKEKVVTATSTTPSSIRILLVEDHGDTANMMQALLETLGCRIKTAGDVAQALDALKKDTFDLLISDLGLPDRSGLDLMEELRKRGNKLKGIALSGFGREEDVKKSREAGFAEHLTKPIDFDVLTDAVERVARSTNGGAHDSASFR